MAPPLTSMEIPRAEIARIAVDMLKTMIEQGQVPEPVRVYTRLICRASTAVG